MPSCSRPTRRSRSFAAGSGESAQSLRDVLEFEKALDLQIERLGHYASLRSSEDSSDAGNLSREGQFENLLTRIGEASAFVAPEIQAIPDADFERFLRDPALAEWQVPLRKLRRLKPHTLSASEERLLALGHSALRGHSETFSQLTNVDMKFGTIIDEKGVERPLSQSALFFVPGQARRRTCASAPSISSTPSSPITNSPSPRRSRIR